MDPFDNQQNSEWFRSVLLKNININKVSFSEAEQHPHILQHSHSKDGL